MNSCGIYTLANDYVYDQLVALLNSIEVNIGLDIPVCVIPFDDQLDRVKEEIDSRPNVTLFCNREAIERWETFAQEVVAAHPRAKVLIFLILAGVKVVCIVSLQLLMVFLTSLCFLMAIAWR